MELKNCSRCGIILQCGFVVDTSNCWCNKYPTLFVSNSFGNCICEACLFKAIKQNIDEYVQGMTPQKALLDNKVAALPKAKYLLEVIDYYIENEFTVFTSWYHLKRGFCCKNSCRHCPYGFIKK